MTKNGSDDKWGRIDNRVPCDVIPCIAGEMPAMLLAGIVLLAGNP